MVKVYLLFPSVIFLLFAVGCSSDKTVDMLKQDIAHLKSQMTDVQKNSTDTEMKISSIENKLYHIEEKSKDLENQIFSLSVKVEEGPEIELPAISEEKEFPLGEKEILQPTAEIKEIPPLPAEVKEIPPSPAEVKEIPPPPKEETPKLETPPPEVVKDVPAENKKTEDEFKKLVSLSPEELYKKAYNHFTASEYDKAISLFKMFLDNHPASELADNSQYWIGECYFGKKDYTAALSEFQKVVEKFPKGNKLPDAMFKIGYTYYKLGDKKSAITELNNVINKFPKKNAAKLARKKIKSIEKEK